MAGHRGKGRTAWLTLILLPLAAWAVLAALAATPGKAQQSTGDELLDRYCSLIRTDRFPGRWGNYGLEFPGLTPAAESILAGWEDEFGDDPRYWTLRYFASQSDSGLQLDSNSILANHPKAYFTADEPAYNLEEARRRGVADGAALFILLKRYERIWAGAALYHDITRGYPVLASPEDYREARKLVEITFGPEQEELVTELLAVAPDEAQPHYYLALLAAQREDYDQAIEELSLGNRAARNTALVGYPYDEICRRMRSDNPRVEKIAGGLICVDEGRLSSFDSYRVKQITVVLAENAVARQDLPALAELHAFACRYGDVQGLESFNALVAHDLMYSVWHAVSNDWQGPVSREQRQALDELQKEIDRLDYRLQTNLSSVYWPSYSTPPWQLSPPELTGLLLSGGRSGSTKALEQLFDDTLAEQQALGGPIHDLFQEIARFDYTTLSWRDE